jgi:hypothetical protein
MDEERGKMTLRLYLDTKRLWNAAFCFLMLLLCVDCLSRSLLTSVRLGP